MSKSLLYKYRLKFKLLFRYYYGIYIRPVTDYLNVSASSVIINTIGDTKINKYIKL